jgi:2-oxoglutarate ferredoxin oxidoreductase subunit alpha
MTDGYIGQGTELFRIPKVADMPSITPPLAKAKDPNYKPYRRDEKTLVRQWALPGTEGLEHRVGGLEKTDIFGAVSTDPINHDKMVSNRNEKVQRVADYIPEQDIIGEDSGDVLVVSWGGTRGQVYDAVKNLQKQGKKISLAHFKYIMPLPKNTADIFAKFKKIVVCELNDGQFANYLRIVHPQFNYIKYNKIKGIPFTTTELINTFNQIF